MPTQRLSRPGCLDRITHEAVDVVVLDPTLQTNSTQYTKVSRGPWEFEAFNLGLQCRQTQKAFN